MSAALPRGPRHPFLLLLLLLAPAACGGTSGTPPDDPPNDVPVVVAPRGTAATFDVGTWNVLWFGDTDNGPEDETTQRRRVRDVLKGADLDLWGLQEVVGRAAFTALLAELPGYTGLLADDPSVVDGAAYYSDFGNREQKVALVFKSSVVEVLGARIVLTARDQDFAGRPPLEVRIRMRLGGTTQDAVVLVLHAKADADVDAWERRGRASEALKAYLDATWPTARVWVIGDFNDDVDTSILVGRPSPYAAFMADTPRWSFPTAALSAAGTRSTVRYPDPIDHHLVSNEALATYVSGSVEAYRVDAVIADYGSTTSDHFPVLARYRIP